MALPPDAVQVAVASSPLSVFNVTGKLIGAPSVADAPPMESVGAASSLLIVPVAEPAVALSVALTALLSATVKVSSASWRGSPITVTLTVSVVSPALKSSVPVVCT